MVKIVRSGITRREFGISPGHNGILKKTRQSHLITRLKNVFYPMTPTGREYFNSASSDDVVAEVEWRGPGKTVGLR